MSEHARLDSRGAARATLLHEEESFYSRLAEHLAEEGLDETVLILASELARLAPDADRCALVSLIAALELRRAEGSTRLDLLSDDAFRRLGVGVNGTELDRAGTLVREAAEDIASAKPFVRAGRWLQSAREWAQEQRVGEAVRLRTAHTPPVYAEPLVSEMTLTDEQARAVRQAQSGMLTLIQGGPGTGKTSIVVAILEQLVASGVGIDEIALAAPTGKAADRLRQSVVARAPAMDAIEASTLHRLLSYSAPQRRFLRHARNPLRARYLIVDECSMVDLAMFDRLFAAAVDVRLVLLGDADQLPSVDAGAVFRDLCEAFEGKDVLCTLTKSFRMDASNPQGRAVYECAQAIRAAKLELDAVSAPSFSGVERLEAREQESFLLRWYEEVEPAPVFAKRAYRSEFSDEDRRMLEQHLGLLEGSKLLSLTRGGPMGAIAINEHLHKRLLPTGGARFARGEPVIVVSNDYELGLFNGDQGVILQVGGELSAVFRGSTGYRHFPLRVVQHRIERAWCLTVHKSQGSEYERVGLFLPEGARATRELVYTAVTRAKRSVTLIGSEATVKKAVETPLIRQCGLIDQLNRRPL